MHQRFISLALAAALAGCSTPPDNSDARRDDVVVTDGDTDVRAADASVDALAMDARPDAPAMDARPDAAPSACPEETPALGAACTRAGGTPCTYVVSDGICNVTRHCACGEGSWVCVEDTRGVCDGGGPEDVPADGACGFHGAGCSADGDCCEGVCEFGPRGGFCGSGVDGGSASDASTGASTGEGGFCRGPAESCTSSFDCCSGSCVARGDSAKVCGEFFVPDGGGVDARDDARSCRPLGARCDWEDDCCSHWCLVPPGGSSRVCGRTP